MSAYYPPTNFFQNINFNNDFYAIPNNNQGISLAYANTHYLFSTGVATSTAITTLFSGSVGIGTIGGNAGTLNALNINAINSLQINGNDISNIYVSSNVIPNYLLPYDKITDRQDAITAVNNNLTNNYYNRTSIDNSLNLKQNNLTFSSPLTNNANTISINLSAYDLITDRQTAITTVNNNLTNNYYNKTTIDNSLNLKQNNLTFSSPLTNNANTISINLSAYDLITDRQAAINTVNNVLNTCIKQGDTLSGDVKLVQIVGGAYLNIEFNASHFKDIGVAGLVNRQFNLNDTYANLPTSKNNVITWISPLTYNSSTDTASIDLSNYYNKSEIVNISNNTSNYASNISNVLLVNSSNYASNISNIIIRNTSNYASNISNVLLVNSSNYASNISNIIIINSSNYASNISNVLFTTFNISNLNSSNYASNISNVIIVNSSNYASNISNVLLNTLNISNFNSSNYASNISNVLLVNTSNYASNISNVLLNTLKSGDISTSNYASNISNVIMINSSNYASNISNVLLTNMNNNYLKLSGGELTGSLSLRNNTTNFWYNTNGTTFVSSGFSSYFSLNANIITGWGVIPTPFITVYNRMWKNVGNTAIDIKTSGQANNNVNSDVLIRIDSGGDPTVGANQGTILFNINGSDRHLISAATLNINTITSNGNALNVVGTAAISGNVGIGTTNAYSLLHIKGTNPALTIMAQGNTGATAQLNLSTYDTTTNLPNCSLIATDTGSFGATFQIKQKTAGADANTQFTSLFIDNTGNVGIKTTNTNNNILQVGNAGRLKIGSGTTDYSLIGTLDTDGATNTRIVISGNTRTSFSGNIDYVATNTGSHIFYTTNSSTERMRIDTNGNVNIGTTGQSYKLYVNGTTYVNGTLTVPNTITTNSINNSLISYFTPTPYNNGSTSTNQAIGSKINLCCATTVGFANVFPYLSVECSDIANNIGTIVYLSSTGQYWTGYNFNARLIIDSSYATNSGLPMGGSIFFQTSDTNNVSGTTFKTICTVNSKGFGIGSGNINYPLTVNTTANNTFGNVYVRTGYNGGSDFNSTSYNANISAAFAGSIYITSFIINSSDIRIKKEINDIHDDGALRQILAIQPKTYKYIDELGRGSSIVYGFIAQQVKEVIPLAVEFVKDIIPNIYKTAICNSNIITLDNDVSQDLNIGDKIKIYDELGKDDVYDITEINSNIIKIDKDINSSNVFVYGKEINDFHTLKKDYIFTLNVCATQELYKLIQQQNNIIQNLQTQIDELKSKIN
jgi:hypothetical protein